MKYKETERKYKALANSRRLAIIAFLNKENRATVGQIAAEINLSLKATSKHLQILKIVGFVDSNQVSLEQYYFLPDKKNPFIQTFLANL